MKSINYKKKDWWRNFSSEISSTVYFFSQKWLMLHWWKDTLQGHRRHSLEKVALFTFGVSDDSIKEKNKPLQMLLLQPSHINFYLTQIFYR